MLAPIANILTSAFRTDTRRHGGSTLPRMFMEMVDPAVQTRGPTRCDNNDLSARISQLLVVVDITGKVRLCAACERATQT